MLTATSVLSSHKACHYLQEQPSSTIVSAPGASFLAEEIVGEVRTARLAEYLQDEGVLDESSEKTKYVLCKLLLNNMTDGRLRPHAACNEQFK